MLFEATGYFNGEKQTIKWQDGQLYGSNSIIEKIMLMDKTFQMEVIPSIIILDLSDAGSVYYFLKYHLFDDEPHFIGKVPIEEPPYTIY